MRRVLLLTTLSVAAGTPLFAQERDATLGWTPSAWGPTDARGAANRLTPAKTLAAIELVTAGVTYDLSHPLESGIPAIAGRQFALSINAGGPAGDNGVVYHDDTVLSDLGHVGTHLDALGHVGTRVGDEDIYFNGRNASDFRTDSALLDLSIDQVGPIITRGILLDVASEKGVERLEPGYVVTAADLEQAANATGLDVRSGDAVMIRTGYGALWMTDNRTYSRNYPGVGMEATEWLADHGVTVVGADNLSVNVSTEIPGRPWELHQRFIAHHGIYLLENANLEALSRDDVSEFLFVFLPLNIKGGTGSPGTPVAVR